MIDLSEFSYFIISLRESYYIVDKFYFANL